ncbi:unnamed protein product [Mucor fragilis]
MHSSNTTPLSGWLQKLTTTNAFGASRWQTRYFVLLDSEMRYYKDEHSVTASRTVNLGDISKVIMTSSPNHPYSFRLEPTLYAQHHAKNQKKTWTMECKSATELELWVSAINYRLCKLLKLDDDQEQEEQAGIVSPTLQPFSTPEQKRAQPFMSLFRVLTTSSSESSDSIEQQYTPQPRPLRKHNPSISRRRGVIISPLDMDTIPGLENDMLSSSSSRGSSLPSPKTQTILERDDEEEEEEEECQHETKGRANKVVAHNAYVLDTFALYKERYHL